MRHTPRMVRLATAGLLAALLMALGCASRKQVTTAETEPPPPPVSQPETNTTPPPPPPAESEPETRSTLSDAFFDFDEASLRADAKAALENNAKWMEKNSGNVIVEGH
jgi:outer membrane protein OmpA-like peptidoglycan-associated protein